MGNIRDGDNDLPTGSAVLLNHTTEKDLAPRDVYANLATAMAAGEYPVICTVLFHACLLWAAHQAQATTPGRPPRKAVSQVEATPAAKAARPRPR